MSDLQRSIGQWADKAFGPVRDIRTSVSRANKEMAELVEHAIYYPTDAHGIVTEAADVVICLYRLAETLNLDLEDVIRLKMNVNEKRQWKPDGQGHGTHIKGIAK